MTATDISQTQPTPHKQFLLVGIGASAGGVTALQQLFATIPADSGMAYAVVLHLSQEHESNLDAILQNKTQMPVLQVSEPIKVAPNHVYVIPPRKFLELEDGIIQLREPERIEGKRISIDHFFRTLAETYGTRAVSIILSGTGTDGTLGVKHIKERDGFVIVQDPAEAEYDGMLRSAIDTGLVDVVVPIPQMAQKLLAVRDSLERFQLASQDDKKLAEHIRDADALRDIITLLRIRTGNDFSNYKEPTILRRIARHLQIHELDNLPDYLNLLRERPQEVDFLLNNLRINVTNFFLDREAFEEHAYPLELPIENDPKLQPSVGGNAMEEVVRRLEEELQRTKERLRNTVEQYEISLEELKASNEELQAINEELRSASEELETSKEELQSVNEELTTVNYELKESLEEVSRAKADIQNLMFSTNIGTIFLDRNLQIKRFTPEAQKLFNIIPTDIGRPITHLTRNLDYDSLAEDAQHVLQTLQAMEREVHSQDGKWYLARTLPYRTVEDRIDGVVLTFVDITDRKKAEEALRESVEHFRLLAENVPALIWINDTEGCQYVNKQYLDFLGVRNVEIRGYDWTQYVHPEDLKAYLESYRTAFENRTLFETQFRFLRHDGNYRWMKSIGTPRLSVAGEFLGYIGSTTDISNILNVQEALRESEDRFRLASQAVQAVIYDWNVATNQVERSYELFDLLGFDPSAAEVSTNAWYRTRVHPDDDKRTTKVVTDAIEAKLPVFKDEHRVQHRDGHYVWVHDSGVFLYDAAGNAIRCVGSLTDITERKRQEFNLLFLTEISQDLAQLDTIEEIMNTVGAKIGTYLQVTQCLFAQINEAQDQVLVEHVWHNEASLDLTGEYQLSKFVTEEFQQAARAKEAIVIPNTQTDARTDANSYAAVNIYAFVTVPFHRGEAWKYLLTVNDSQPRDWRKEEVELIRELANRLFQRLERARAEEALRRSEQELRLITDAIPALIAYVDKDYIYRFVNKMYTQWFGYKPEDILGKHVREMLGKAVYEVVLPNLQKVLAGEELTFERLLTYKNAGERYVHVNYIPDVQPDGKVKGYYALVQDITERARAEEALRNSEEKYRNLFNSIDEGFCVCEMLFDEANNPYDYLFLEINPMYAKLTGLDNAVGKTARELTPYLEEKWFEIYSKVVLTGEAVRFESHLEAWDKWYDLHVSRVGKPEELKFAILFSDITNRKQAEEALRDADRRKNEFLATLAHELRNPLTPIRSALEILNHTDNPAQAQQARTIIERQIRKIVILVDDLLEISRITRGKIQLHKEVISVQAVIKDVIETTEPLMVAAGHQFTLQVPEEVICIDADDVRIAQIIINIVNNAIKYTNTDGQISLTVATENDQVIIRIKDNGVGIPTDRLESIFEIFEQVEHAGKKFQSGLGIGLSLAKELTELHGGTITAHSEGQGKGSEFTIRLPLAEDQTPLNDEPPCDDEPVIPAFAGNRKRILVVEDDIDIADMLQAVLELENYKVQIANSGESAIQVAKEFLPEAALVDIGLPDMDGHEVARRLRKEHSDLLLIAHSGWGADEDLQRSKEAGFDYHLVKPAEIEEITALLTKSSGV